MKVAHISFVLRHVLKSFRELPLTHLLTAGTMAMTLSVFGAFLLVQENLQTLLKGWGSQIQVFAYLKNDPGSDEVTQLAERVRSFPEIDGVRFVSKAEAWESFRKTLGAQSGVLEGLQAGILPSSFEITLKKSYRDRPSLERVVKRLREIELISDVEYPEEWVNRLGFLILGVQWGKWIVGVFLMITTLLIVGSTIRLAILARKEEIEIMQLVGASGGLIQAPFVIEGMLQGILGALISLLLLWVLIFAVRQHLPPGLEFFAARTQLHYLDTQGIALLLVLGWAMGAAGCQISLRKYFRRW
ncbi:MAG: ABC transporter permease [Deltaproteobacteria bacterium]|nr:ABC transporter permease [Deltaproteobacteria bacterium]